MSAPAIDWSRIRSVDDVIAPTPFQLDADTGQCPTGTARLWDVEHGSRVVDSAGNRYLLMGYGSVQGTVILRDRYRRMFHADGSSVYRPAS